MEIYKRISKINEGIVSNSPKSCFRELFSVGLISEEDTVKCLEMTARRNDTSHTYKEEVSRIIYGKLKDYAGLISKIIQIVRLKI